MNKSLLPKSFFCGFSYERVMVLVTVNQGEALRFCAAQTDD